MLQPVDVHLNRCFLVVFICLTLTGWESCCHAGFVHYHRHHHHHRVDPPLKLQQYQQLSCTATVGARTKLLFQTHNDFYPKAAERNSRQRDKQYTVAVSTKDSEQKGQQQENQSSNERNTKTVTTTTIDKHSNDDKFQQKQSETTERKVKFETQRMDPRSSYESAFEALKSYHSIHSDLIMPRRFIVPDDEAYPSEWIGFDLSSTVYDVKWWEKHIKHRRDRVKELNALGFIWERLRPEWDLIYESLLVFKSLHGNLMVPQKFVIPRDDPVWPKATWGLALGSLVTRMRLRHDFLRGSTGMRRMTQLDQADFIWDPSEYRFQTFCRAFYHYGKLLKQREEKNNDEREKQKKLMEKIIKNRKAKNNNNNDNDNNHEDDEEEKDMKILELGRTSHIRVPSQYIVPDKSPHWPSHMWNYPLGIKCHQIRTLGLYVKDNPRRQAILDDLGFHWQGNAALGWLAVVHAAALYSQLHGRRLDVPFSFRVPSPPSTPLNEQEGEEKSKNKNVNDDDGSETRTTNGENIDDASSSSSWPWPEYLWGFPLGQRLKDVRCKGAYLHGDNAAKRRAQLDALGFEWSPKRGRKRQRSTKKE